MGTTPTDVVLAAGGAPWEPQALAQLERSRVLRLTRRCVDTADLLAVIGSGLAEVALISTDLHGLDLDVVDRLTRGGVRVVAVEAERADADRLGLGRPYAVEDLDGVADLSPAEAEPAREQAPIIAVWGPTGAPGRSSVALTMASALAARQVDTVLVDADVDGGAQAQMLGLLGDSSGLVAACRAANHGRLAEVDLTAETVQPNLRLVSGLPRADMWPQVRPSALKQVLDRLASIADRVVVDCGFGLEGGATATGVGSPPSQRQATVTVLERADEIVVVGRAEPLGLTRLVRALHDLAEVVPHRAPRVVINQDRRSLGWSAREVDATVSRLTGIAPALHLPFDQAAWDAAALAGRVPREVAPSSPFVARVEAFTSALVATSP